MSTIAEVGDLVEIFQWLTEDQSRQVATDARTAEAVGDELADMMIYLVRLASVLCVDLDYAVRARLCQNAVKYPVVDSTPIQN